MAIKCIRIDDRLIHGQIVVKWIKTHQAKRVWIIDDDLSQDEFLVDVMRMVMPSGAELLVTDSKDIPSYIEKFEGEESNTLFLVKTPAYAKKIFDEGLQNDRLNIGGVGANANRQKFYKNISLNQEEIAIFKELSDRGIDVYIQMVPDDKEVSFASLIK